MTVRRQLFFAGSVQFLGETRAVSIYLTDSDDALIGTSLRADCRLLVDLPAAVRRLTRKPPCRSKHKVEERHWTVFLVPDSSMRLLPFPPVAR